MPYFRDHGFRVVALSLRGHGGSAGAERIRSTRIADYVADVRQVVDGLDPAPVVIGHSMGGFVVQKYLQSLTPDERSIPLAALLSAVPPGGVKGFSFRMLKRHPLLFVKSVGLLKLSPMFNSPELFRSAFLSPTVPTVEVEGYLELMSEESFAAFLDLFLLDLPKPKKVTTPLLVFGADNDFAVSPKESRHTAKAYGVDATIFSDMAHDMMLEPGWERAAEQLLTQIVQATPARA